MGYCLCHSSSGPFCAVERTRHWLTPQSVGSVSKLTFSLKNYVDKLAAMLWVLAISLPLHMSRALLCAAQMPLQYMCVNAFPIPTADSNIDTHVAVGWFVWKHLTFLRRGRANSRKYRGRTVAFHFAPATVVCKSCEVRKHFTSWKANILTAVAAVEAARLIHAAVTFSLSED